MLPHEFSFANYLNKSRAKYPITPSWMLDNFTYDGALLIEEIRNGEEKCMICLVISRNKGSPFLLHINRPILFLLECSGFLNNLLQNCLYALIT